MSITKVSGGLITSLPTETGHSRQLHATHLAALPKLIQSLSAEQVQPSFRHGSEGKSFARASALSMQTFQRMFRGLTSQNYYIKFSGETTTLEKIDAFSTETETLSA